jgi:hypothetical protein
LCWPAGGKSYLDTLKSIDHIFTIFQLSRLIINKLKNTNLILNKNLRQFSPYLPLPEAILAPEKRSENLIN